MLVVSFLIITIILAALFVVLQHYHFSFMVLYGNTQISFTPELAIATILVAILALYLLYSILKSIVTLPARFVNYHRAKHKDKYVDLLSNALVAYMSEDKVKTNKLFNKLNSISDRNNSPALETLHKSFFPLLEAKKLDLAGNKTAAIHTYEDMALSGKEEQRILGLYELHKHAKQDGDFERAVIFAQQAFKISRGFSWANDTLLSRAVDKKDWQGAEEILNKIKQDGSRAAIDVDDLQTKRAMIYAAEAQDVFSKNPAQALKCAERAYAIKGDHVGINIIYLMTLIEGGYERKAVKTLEKLWQENPHPDYAKLYIYGKNNSPAHQLERAKRLQQLEPDNVYSNIALSEVYLNNNNIEEAQNYADKACDAEPLRRCFLHQLAIENAAASVREGIQIKHMDYKQLVSNSYDYAWVGDAISLKHWQALSPKNKILGGVTWQRIDEQNEFLVDDYLFAPQHPAIAAEEPKEAIEAQAKQDPIEEAQLIEEEMTRLNVDDPGL